MTSLNMTMPPSAATGRGIQAEESTSGDGMRSNETESSAGHRAAQIEDLDVIVNHVARDAMIGESMALAILATVEAGGDVVGLTRRQLPEWQMVAARLAAAGRSVRR